MQYCILVLSIKLLLIYTDYNLFRTYIIYSHAIAIAVTKFD